MEALFGAAGLNPIGTKRRDRITLPSLRHTFRSWLAIAGLPVRRIQELLGHKSIVTTGAVQLPGRQRHAAAVRRLARASARGFLNPGATPVSGTQQLRAAEVPQAAAKNFLITCIHSPSR
jgi:hypothetical protein